MRSVVVVGNRDEIQSFGPRFVRELRRAQGAVAVIGMRVERACVPRRASSERRGGLRCEGRGRRRWRLTRRFDPDFDVHAFARDFVEPEHHVPLAGGNRSRPVARRRFVDRDGDGVAFPAA